jgi:hypothetical protein
VTSNKPAFEPRKNLSDDEIRDLIKASRLKAVRHITDPRNGDKWYWPAEQATHAWGAEHLGVPYEAYGGGPVLMLED